MSGMTEIDWGSLGSLGMTGMAEDDWDYLE